MSRVLDIGPCPDAGDLVRFNDRTLSSAAHEVVSRHLWRCRTCRMHRRMMAHSDVTGREARFHPDTFARFERFLNGLFLLRQSLRERALIEPLPQERAFYARLHEPHRTARSRAWLRIRIHMRAGAAIGRGVHASIRARRWAPVAALIPLLAAGSLMPSAPATVRAEALLARTATQEPHEAADRRPPVDINITLTQPPSSSAGSSAVDGREGRGARDALDARDARVDGEVLRDPRRRDVLERLASVHHFDPRRPLAVAWVQAWRQSLAHKRDDISVTSDMLLLLHTSTGEGLVRDARLTIRPDTYQVVRLTLVLDAGQVLVAERDSPLDGTSDTARRVTPARVEAASSSIAMSSTRPMTPPPPPRVEMGLPQRVRPDAVTIPSPGLPGFLDRAFGQRPIRTTFFPDLLQQMSIVQHRLRTLQELAARYPDRAAVSRLSRRDRVELQRRLDQDFLALRAALGRLDRQLIVMIGSTTLTVQGRRTPSDWRARTAAGVTHAAALERVLRHLLTFDDLPADETRSGTQGRLERAFSHLWHAVNPPRPATVEQ